MDGREHLKIYWIGGGGGGERRGRDAKYLHGPTIQEKKLEARFQVGDLELPDKWRYANGRVDEEVDAPNYPCGKVVKSRTFKCGNVKCTRRNWTCSGGNTGVGRM